MWYIQRVVALLLSKEGFLIIDRLLIGRRSKVFFLAYQSFQDIAELSEDCDNQKSQFLKIEV